ncbi:MAG: glycosyltransferase [Chloroflexota bacterium]|jgi:trehalose synthase
MYGSVQVSRRSLDEHRLYVGDEIIDTLRSLALPLKGARILNLSISPFGTGVSDLLHSLVPLLKDLGLDVEWQIVACNAQFASLSRLLYDALCGRNVDWTSAISKDWLRYNRSIAQLFDQQYDLVVLHDPQLAGLPAAIPNHKAKAPHWVWHCHLDLRNALPEAWFTLFQSLQACDLCVFPDHAFAPQGLEGVATLVIPPAIDPTAARNVELPGISARQLLGQHGIDPDRPLLVQAGPLDPAFDPTGAVDVYRQVKAHRADVQLLLVHTLSENSIEAWARYERVARYTAGDRDAQVLVGQGDNGQLVVNAALHQASVVIQRSVPAGFAIPVWEAQWKGRPVVVGTRGGLASQIIDCATGYVAGYDASFVKAALELIVNQDRASRLGKEGRHLVRHRYLITRFLADELRLIQALLGNDHFSIGEQPPPIAENTAQISLGS